MSSPVDSTILPPSFDPGLRTLMDIMKLYPPVGTESSLEIGYKSLEISYTLPTQLTGLKGRGNRLPKPTIRGPVYVFPLGTRGKYAHCDPKGWKQYVHINGSPWYKQESDRNDARPFKVEVLTDVDLSDVAILKQTNKCIDAIFRYIQSKQKLLEDLQLRDKENSAPVQLVVETLKDDDRCGYYFVCHETRSIFWPEMTLMAGLESSMSSPYVSLSHFRLDLECQYWRHWEHFANIQVVTDEIYDELMNLLLYDIVGRSNEGEGLQNKGSKGSPPIIGRLMFVYKRRQFSTYWGENFARTGRDQWMREHSYTLFLWAVSPWFFGAPNALLRGLDDIFINKQVAIEPWRQFMRNLHAEWQDFILNSAVLLAANVAFLAIQSIDGNKDRPEFRSPPQIASYVSTLMSISSIFAGLLLVHNTREKVQDSILEAFHYLRARHSGLFGFVPLAIVYSLPYILLLYALVSFIVAFLLVCFSDTTTVTRGLVGGFGLMCFMHTVNCVMMNWDHGIFWWLTSVGSLRSWLGRWRFPVWRWRRGFATEQQGSKESLLPH
ncbi:hypothetical protein PLEOSDRAFT_1096724 [Pleurotus ostreatus PC15]|uniref:WW domain-containing protein n=1 Tax=Pleurotus ostreatus (strain PC15) TaxID=1137138 RepID=A0A067P047_PLEO1|nr:hypothetical protein PLEOSDRAFT_1096724 [Pleurotus ostreatus PC15]